MKRLQQANAMNQYLLEHNCPALPPTQKALAWVSKGLRYTSNKIATNQKVENY
ncbi:MAG: hypothetical protein IPL33_06665 [Sphingobacteriales bacterium]|nr:hypothetical protein [Sphingobacteriales bacterium]MCC7223067.1 hypothetical protein [Chitinophagales bacterium]